MDRIKELVKIGMALSAEKNLDRLLEMIVSEARRFTNADGGTLYIKNERERTGVHDRPERFPGDQDGRHRSAVQDQLAGRAP